MPTEYIYNPAVCPSSLDYDTGKPFKNETAHKWDETSNPVSCSECGKGKDQVEEITCTHSDELVDWEGVWNADARAYFGTCKCGERVAEIFEHVRTVVIDKDTFKELKVIKFI